MSELREPETKKRRAPKTAFKKGKSGNPGGQSKEKREFLEQMRDADGDAKKIYRAFIKLVSKGNATAILWGMGHIVGKPPDKVELTGKDGGPLFALIAKMPRLTGEDLESLHAIARRAIGAGVGAAEGGGTREETPKPP